MSLVDTRIQNIRGRGNLGKDTLRRSRYGAWDFFMLDTDIPGGIITEELKQKSETSIGSVVQTWAFDFDAGITIGNVRNAVIADSQNTSKLITITYVTYAFGFTIVPDEFHNNEVRMQEDFDRKIKKYLYQFASDLDTTAVAKLESDKTQIIADPLEYAFVANTIVAEFAEANDVIGDINAFMESNDFYAPLHVVANTGTAALTRKLMQQGEFNNENKVLEFNDKQFHWSNRVTNATDRGATMFAIPEGTVGILKRHEIAALKKQRTGISYEWDISFMPIINMPMDTYYYESVDNFSAIGGAATAHLTRAWKQHYGFSVDIAFVTAYNTDPATLAGGIIKVEIKTSTAI